ncbi:hypothetical protein E4T56_gene16111 [Termitomyces sp. T112]|nr:hypothetical protein E4T56_gene16111 [Termitomyces sp. T112]
MDHNALGHLLLHVDKQNYIWHLDLVHAEELICQSGPNLVELSTVHRGTRDSYYLSGTLPRQRLYLILPSIPPHTGRSRTIGSRITSGSSAAVLCSPT